MTQPRRGFSLVQLLVVIGIIALVSTYMVLAAHEARYGHHGNNRVRCQSNLSQIGKALVLYSNENKGAFPRTYAVPGAPISLTNDSFASPVPDALPITAGRTNNLPQAMFLLIKQEDLTPSVFICSSGTAEADTMNGLPAISRSNFTGDGLRDGSVISNVSYSFVNVYPSTAAIVGGYKNILVAMNSDFAVAADISPAAVNDPRWKKIVVGATRSVMVSGNSPNHMRDGQNVLYADGHAEFQQTPLCGSNNDNIYTAQDTTYTVDNSHSASGEDPLGPADSVLLLHAP